SVMTPTFRYNPAVIAQAFATMGCLYPDRIFAGFGTGEALNEIATGHIGEWPAFKERFARLRESVRLMRELWRGDRVDFDGEYYRTVGASIYDVPDREIPVYIAAGGPVVARYAGRAGDGFICTSGKGPELYTDKLMPAVAEGAAKAERDAGTIDKMIEIKISYDTDHERALENTRFWAPLSLTAEQKHSIDDPIEMEAAADALPIEQIAQRWIVASDPDEAVEKVRFYLDAGLNHLVFHAPGHDQRRFLELFERDLAPRLRPGLSRPTGGRHRLQVHGRDAATAVRPSASVGRVCLGPGQQEPTDPQPHAEGTRRVREDPGDRRTAHAHPDRAEPLPGEPGRPLADRWPHRPAVGGRELTDPHAGVRRTGPAARGRAAGRGRTGGSRPRTPDARADDRRRVLPVGLAGIRGPDRRAHLLGR